MSHRILIASLLVACMGLTALPAQAVTVYLTGGDAGDGLTLQSALVLGAVNANSSTSVTIQGVTFATHPVPAGMFAIGSGNFSGTASSYGGSPDDLALQTIAGSGRFGGGSGGVSVTVSTLTPGETYQLDLVQSVLGFAAREQAILVNGVWQENVMLPQHTVAATTVTGIADTSGQILVNLVPSGPFGGTGHQDGGLINGVVVSLTVPEPSTFALLGLAGMVLFGLGFYRRRRLA